MDVTLPNGQVISGVPEDVTQEELMQMAINAGIATPEDFGRMDAQEFAQQNITPMLPEIGGMAGALAGAKMGLAAGAAGGSIIPGAGTVVGGLAGSAIGAFAGAGIGETLRQYFKEEDPDVLRAVGEASTEGAIDLVGGKAFDILKAGKDLFMRSLGYSERSIPEKQLLRDLQRKLQEQYDTTLRGSQVDPNARIISGLEAAAEQAIGPRANLEQIAEAQLRYLDDQVDGIISVSSKLEGEQLGILIKNLVENTRTASSEVFGEAFKELAAKGAGVRVSLQGPRNTAVAWRQTKMEGLTKRMQEKIDQGAKIPFTSGDIQKAVDDILTLSPNTTFDTAFGKLKDLKSRLTAMRGNPATANDPAVAELTNIVKKFEESLLTSARKSSPELADTYEKLMKQYEKTQNILFSDVAVKILNEGSPELVGRSLAAPGLVTPVKEVRKIIAEAKKLGVKQGGDVIKGIRKGFLAKHLSSAEGASLNTLQSFKNKLADPDFARTFNELVPPAEKKRLYRLLEETEILNRGVGGEFSLAVRSAQLAGVQGVAVGGGNAGLIANLAKIITPAKMAEAASDPKLANQMLGMVKIAQKYVNIPEKMPPEVVRAFSAMLAKFSAASASEIEQAERDQKAQEMLPELRNMQQQMLR